MKTAGGIDWDGGGHNPKHTGTKEGEIVAHIHKLKNHTHANDEIWQVEIDGHPFPKRFRYVKDARDFVDRHFSV